MPRPKYKQLKVRKQDYLAFAAFTKQVSAQIGFDVTTVQALRMAVIHFKAKHGLVE